MDNGWKLVNSRKELLLWNVQHNKAHFLGNPGGGNSGKRVLSKEFFWHRILPASNVLSLQEYLAPSLLKSCKQEGISPLKNRTVTC